MLDTNNPMPRERTARLKRAWAIGVLMTPACIAAQADITPNGRWVTASGNLEVEVAPCGKALCGTVTKVLGNRSMSREGEDMQAVDTRPALGMKILQNFQPDSTEGEDVVRWEGDIYNRENGKTYSCQMSLGPNGELIIRPYVVLPLFGKTQIWQRVQPAAQVSDVRETH